MSKEQIRPSNNPSIKDKINPNNSRHTTKDRVRWIDATADYTNLSPCGGAAPVSLNIRHLTDAPYAGLHISVLAGVRIPIGTPSGLSLSHYQNAAAADTSTQLLLAHAVL
jgi:hypothetical protein